MTSRLTPCLWFAGNAEEAGSFYATTLRNTTVSIAGRYPDEVPDWMGPLGGQPLTVELAVDGQAITLINAGNEFRPNPAMSFMLNHDPLMFGGEDAARSALETTWSALAEGGTALMDLGEYPWSPLYGWIEDRFGVSWQLMLTNPTGDPRPFVVPQLMFGGPVVNQARAAAEYYTSLFDDSGLGMVVPYPAASGPAEAGAIMFGEFHLGGQWLSMMDAGVEQDFTFTPGTSLMITCADQAEIDRLWAALSAVPEAEQCGWVTDRFGVSWQIVPENLAELMARPGAFETMQGMKKIVIADF